MAISVVQTQTSTGSSVSSLSVTLTSTGAGNALVVCVAAQFASVSSVQTGGGQSFTQAIAQAAAAQAEGEIWYLFSVASGQTSVTVTLSGSASGVEVAAYEVSGIGTLDQTSSSAITATPSPISWTSGTTATLAHSSEIAIGISSQFTSGGTITGPSSPWTNTSQLNSGTFRHSMAGYDIVSTTTGIAYAGSSTFSGNGYTATAIATFAAVSNVSVSLTTAQDNISAPAPTPSGTVSLTTAQVNEAALPVTVGVVLEVALTVAQETVSALPPGIQHGWTTALTTAQVNIAALPVTPGADITVPLTTAQVNIAAHPPVLSRQLLISLASKAGTDDYGNSILQGIQVTKGVISGTIFEGTDFIINTSGAFFYSSAPASGNLIASIASASGTDGFGNSYNAGITSYVASGTLAGLAANIFEGLLSFSLPAIQQGPEYGTNFVTGASYEAAEAGMFSGLNSSTDKGVLINLIPNGSVGGGSPGSVTYPVVLITPFTTSGATGSVASVVAFNNTTLAPTVGISGAGLLYVANGHLYYANPSGGVTELAT